jgi:hypothetical protein
MTAATALATRELNPRIGHRARPYDPNSGQLLQRTKLAGEESFA